MATLDSTVGGPSANTYADLIFYKAYLSTRLPQVTWLAEALAGTRDDLLTIDLIVGARLLDIGFQWTGQATTSTQARSWPRIGMDSRNGYLIPSNVNPDDLKAAQCEYGIQARNIDLVSDNEAASKNVQRVKAGSVEVEFQELDLSTTEAVDSLIARQMPETAWARVPGQVRDLLVPSWYERETVTESTRQKAVFRVF